LTCTAPSSSRILASERDVDHIGELEELAQPNRVRGDRDLAHPAIILRRPR
jgi:hypothetical protein